jgi:fermentation-respiration switch protein FrsA (DUF1100 family)
MQIVLLGAAGFAVVYVVLGLILFLLQRRILFQPDTTVPDLSRAGEPRPREIAVPTSDGLSLFAWYLPPAEPSGFVVLHLHGNAGNIGHRAFRLGPLHQLGWGVLLLEYRGFGGNPGSPTESGLVTDARAGLAALHALGVQPERIIVWGESLGSNLAVRLASEQPVAAVLLEAPYTSITDIARSRYPFLPVRPLLLDHFDTMNGIGSIRAPLLVMHGAFDSIVPVAMGRALFAAAPEPKELWIASNAGHLDLVEAGAIAAAEDFVRRHMR